MTTGAAAFRAKTNVMKSWRPRNPPSNRDRLELYALHKQSVSGDAPTASNDELLTSSQSKSSSVADKAKMAAWRSKRGMSQADAMAAYVDECDRQLRVYGTRDGNVATPTRPTNRPHQSQQPAATATAETEDTAASQQPHHRPNNTPNTPGTPQNTPAMADADNSNNGGNDGDGNNVLLCPRGLAAIPLLCAAAAESRSAYLARLQVTHPSNGVRCDEEIMSGHIFQ
eukprot:CAMPEP_0181078260 /NCGR_PEP_ID=MMETSP1071-20121207/1389_1 /TAXON_ID=35127 /ORGANISM="Thalassiosira sp., Strain NH16" /LENGTH=226 /DNA_ID=CAMNT_0023159559 /DNA_START=137 /DNA_END=817 /DNA_ORIENTATION=+